MDNEHNASIDGDQWAQCVRDNGWLWSAAAGGVSKQAPTLILAHGSGAPMDSGFMTNFAARLAALGINVLRFEFPYMAQRRLDGGKRPPNTTPKLLEHWREVYGVVRRHVAGPLAIGGKYNLSPSDSIKLELQHVVEKSNRQQLSDNRIPNTTFNFLSVSYNWVWE